MQAPVHWVLQPAVAQSRLTVLAETHPSRALRHQGGLVHSTDAEAVQESEVIVSLHAFLTRSVPYPEPIAPRQLLLQHPGDAPCRAEKGAEVVPERVWVVVVLDELVNEVVRLVD